MKKVLTIIVAVGFISSMLVNTASAGDHHGGGISPLWIPVAILSTLAAVTIVSGHESAVISGHLRASISDHFAHLCAEYPA